MIRARSGYKKMQAHPTTANSRISKQHHHHHHQQKKRIGPFSANAISSVLNSAVMIKSTPYSKDVINRNMEIVLSEDVWVMSAFSLSPDYSSFKVNHVRVVPVLAQQPKDTTNNDPIQQQATTAVAPAENVEHHAPAVNTPLLQAPIQQAVPVVAKKRTRKQKAAAEQHEGHAAPQSSNHEQHENDDLFQ
jgi:coenzyme F420-reducing hydrogenase gamma subunit